MPAATPLRLARRLTTLLCAAACLAVAFAVVGAHRADAYSFNVGVTDSPHGQPVSSNFVGVALEFGEIPTLATPQSVNPVFAALLKGLSPAGRPNVRIGGQSTDRVWWPVRGMARPLGVTYDLTSRWTAAAHAIAQATGAQYLLGINLEANRTRISQVEADQLVRAIGAKNIDALEIGNEPQLYTGVPWYRRQGDRVLPWYSQTGSPVYARPPSYNPEDFVGEVSRTLKVVPT